MAHGMAPRMRTRAAWLIAAAASVVACAGAFEAHVVERLGIFVSWPLSAAPARSEPHNAILALRLIAITCLALGAIHALAIVLWYVRSSTASPRRVWHVVSVGLGVLLLYEQLGVTLATSIIAHAPLTWQSPKIIAAVLFIGCGVQYLYENKRGAHRAH